MRKHTNIFVGSLATASLLSMTAGAGVAPALAGETAAQETATQQSYEMPADVEGVPSAYVKASAVEGEFSWSQGTVTPNSVIRAMFLPATNALCNATEDLAESNPLEWKLSVSGDVDNAFTATVDELAEEQTVKKQMSCTCGGNPSDGGAVITADVKGIPVNYLVERACATDEANTITFVASDGKEVSMPLMYAIGRHAVISFEINGEDLSASVGGNNQLWMTRTSANYFLRDIVEVRVTQEENPPANPGEDMEYPNSPNAGIQTSAVE